MWGENFATTKKWLYLNKNKNIYKCMFLFLKKKNAIKEKQNVNTGTL